MECEVCGKYVHADDITVCHICGTDVCEICYQQHIKRCLNPERQ